MRKQGLHDAQICYIWRETKVDDYGNSYAAASDLVLYFWSCPVVEKHKQMSCRATTMETQVAASK